MIAYYCAQFIDNLAWAATGMGQWPRYAPRPECGRGTGEIEELKNSGNEAKESLKTKDRLHNFTAICVQITRKLCTKSRKKRRILGKTKRTPGPGTSANSDIMSATSAFNIVARASRPRWRERPAPARGQDTRAPAGGTPALRLITGGPFPWFPGACRPTGMSDCLALIEKGRSGSTCRARGRSPAP